MQKKHFLILIFLITAGTLAAVPAADECTSAVITGEANIGGAPILWKNRDTSVLSNRVVYVKETPYSYIGLVNRGNRSGSMCYAGLNSEGFAIMNTVAYNLPEKEKEMKDLEGVIMADALRKCRTIYDFEQYIKARLGPELGSLANFGVMDADGKAMLFEIHNGGFYKIDPGSTAEKYLINTNFARNGEKGKGHGYIRFNRATELFKGFPPFRVDFRDILRKFSRDTANGLSVQMNVFDLDSLPADTDKWINTRDCINRPSTASAVVILGKNNKNPRRPATFWVIPGEPVTAIALPLWVEAGSVPECLWKGDEVPMWTESLRIKKMIRQEDMGHQHDYLNLVRLNNADGTGYLPLLLNTEAEIIRETEAFLKTDPGREQLREFQNRMAQKALKTLKSIH